MLAKMRIYQKGHKRSCLQQHSGQQKQLKNGHNNDLPMMLQKKTGDLVGKIKGVKLG